MVKLIMVNANIWSKKTFDFVRNKNYLDELLEIYPAELPPPRSLPNYIKNEIIKLYNAKEYTELILLLISLKDYPFPIEHPYASLLRHLDKEQRIAIIKRNPVLVKKLSEILVSLGLNNIIKGIERPKDINRALGATFKSWIHKKFTDKPFKIVGKNDLLKCNQEEICIYVGPDKEIANFVKKYLHLSEPEKGFYNRDIIVRIRNTYIIGEARFLSTPGGSQGRDLENTLRFVELMEDISKNVESKGIKVKGIALLDGIAWFYEEYVNKIMDKAIGDRVVMSALFLREYLLSIFNESS
jgi:hypothetical protein